MRIFELSECPARAVTFDFVATDAGYGKLGRCGLTTRNSWVAKSGETMEILSVYAHKSFRIRLGEDSFPAYGSLVPLPLFSSVG